MKEEFFWEGHPYIALNDLLKMVGVAEICGRAKLTVTDRLISVNGEENLVKQQNFWQELLSQAEVLKKRYKNSRVC